MNEKLKEMIDFEIQQIRKRTYSVCLKSELDKIVFYTNYYTEIADLLDALVARGYVEEYYTSDDYIKKYILTDKAIDEYMFLEEL